MTPEIRPGVVSVVLVNYKGADDTIVALRSFAEVNWPAEKLELIVVDNDSGDGSEDRIRAAVPEAIVIQSGGNLGFAGGCNLGVAHASGEFLAFLNNDARPDREWISAAVAELERDGEVGCVASKVLNWEGDKIDYVDGSLTWFGMGYKRETEWAVSDKYDVAKDVLFATGSAMFMRTAVFRQVGGFDEMFFMFYEDVDLGWRLNLLGYKVRYVPGSVAFHKHHVTMKKFGNYRESYLLERNALLAMYKNLDDESLGMALPATLALTVRRSLSREGADGNDIAALGAIPETFDVPKTSLTGPYAVDFLLANLDAVQAERDRLQAARQVDDEDLFVLFRHAIEPAYPIPSYLEVHNALVTTFDIAHRFISRTHVLVVTGEPISDRLAGPAIRACEIAKALSGDHDVRLVSTGPGKAVDPSVKGDGFEIFAAQGEPLRPHTDWADIIVFQGFLLEGAPWLADPASRQVIVADVYDPMHLEQLEQAKDLGEDGRIQQIGAVTQVLNKQLARGDYFLCASGKQRDFWLGQLASQGRITKRRLREDPDLSSLISVVPFGIGDADPVQRRHGIKGVVPGIGASDKVILWGGGLYNWFDPLTLIQSVADLATRHPDVRLYFMGVKHPNPNVPAMRIATEAQQLSKTLGLTNSHVFFNSDWTPYEERANVLLDADLGVSTHFSHVETEYSFRTRILDYLWAGLPIVATSGDDLGNAVGTEGLGRTVPAQDVDALTAALEALLYDAEASAAARAAVARYRERFRWRTVLEPLVEFCRSPRRDTTVGSAAFGPVAHPYPKPPRTWRRNLELVSEYWRAGGAGFLVKRVGGRLMKLAKGTAER